MAVPRAVVVGASAAGLSAADGLRDGGWSGDITVLGAELHAPYDRPMLSKSLLSSHGVLQPQALRTPEHLASNQIDLQLGQRAMGLDIDRRLVVTNNGDAVPYDTLVIATGSRPRPVVTTSGENLPCLRDLDDLAKVRQLTSAGRPTVLIGSGFIGLEVAAALRARDIPVTILGSQAVPLTSCVGEGVGRWLHEMHREHGVQLRTGVKVFEVSGVQGNYRIELEDSTYQLAEVILAGIGALPADDWLRGSGVALNQGVLCDEAGRTSVPGVWAAGDVAVVHDTRSRRRRRFEHWTNAVEQGYQVGLNVARGTAEPTPRLLSLWTEQYGKTLRMLGSREPGDVEVTLEGATESGEFMIAHARGGEVHAITACGMDRRVRGYRKLLQRSAQLSEFESLAAGQRRSA